MRFLIEFVGKTEVTNPNVPLPLTRAALPCLPDGEEGPPVDSDTLRRTEAGIEALGGDGDGGPANSVNVDETAVVALEPAGDGEHVGGPDLSGESVEDGELPRSGS